MILDFEEVDGAKDIKEDAKVVGDTFQGPDVKDLQLEHVVLRVSDCLEIFLIVHGVLVGVVDLRDASLQHFFGDFWKRDVLEHVHAIL